MDDSTRPMWERSPNETDKSFAAFQVYLTMPILSPEAPDEARTLANLSQRLGYSAPIGKVSTVLEKWSSKYHWQERVRAYEAHNAAITITVRDANIEVFQSDVIARSSAQVAVYNQIIDRKLMAMLKAIDNNEPVDALSIVRLGTAIRTKDDLARRLAGMATNYTTEKVDEVNLDTQTFIIGGDNG